MRVGIDLTYQRGVPVCCATTTGCWEPALAAVRRQFGEAAVTEGVASLGGEDFALMAERVPAFHLRIGSSQEGPARPAA